MEIRRQDSNLTLRGEASAISCPVGVHLIRAVMFSIIALKRTFWTTGALSHNNNHPERVLLQDFKY